MSRRTPRAAAAALTLLVAAGCTAADDLPAPRPTEISTTTASRTPAPVPTGVRSPAPLRLPAATARTLASVTYTGGRAVATVHATTGGAVVLTAACTSSSPARVVDTTVSVLRADPDLGDAPVSERTVATTALTCDGEVEQIDHQLEPDRAVQVTLGQLDGVARAYAVVDER